MLFTFLLTDIDYDDVQRHLCGQVWGNKYYYLNQLMALDACRPLCEDANLNSSLSVTSPLISNNWSRELSFHPDKAYTQYVLRGISQGFRIGYNRHHHLCSHIQSCLIKLLRSYLSISVKKCFYPE